MYKDYEGVKFNTYLISVFSKCLGKLYKEIGCTSSRIGVMIPMNLRPELTCQNEVLLENKVGCVKVSIPIIEEISQTSLNEV